MAQVTINMCDHIIKAADKQERFPLTVNEMRQLAYLARSVLEVSENKLAEQKFRGGAQPDRPVSRK